MDDERSNGDTAANDIGGIYRETAAEAGDDVL
jgi:hypothetical protein